MDEFQQANRRNWDDRAALHRTDPTGSYRIATVLAGGSSLHPLEAGEIGSVVGKDVIHLQCHIGLDTISLKHLGAKSVTGLDFSPNAIAACRDFALRAGTEVRFVEASVYDAIEALGEQCDFVFVSWGAINWLNDIFRWAQIVSELLRPGGKLYMVEGHPQLYQFELREGKLEVAHDWTTPRDKPLVSDEEKTYTGDERPLVHTRCYEWFHPLSDVVNALIQAGLAIDFLNEHEIITWKATPDMVPIGDDQFVLAPHHPRIPLSYSIGATKPEK